MYISLIKSSTKGHRSHQKTDETSSVQSEDGEEDEQDSLPVVNNPAVDIQDENYVRPQRHRRPPAYLHEYVTDMEDLQ